MECPACRAEVPDGARFCPACGHALVLATDERRVATVLFADLVGFTGLAEGRDPERVKAFVDRCLAALADDLTSYGGRVDKVLGDAIIGLFGAPVAHEDDAERAVRAALQMRRTIDRLAEETGAPLQLRIGINTGEVLVGALRAGGDYTAMGDAVNVASRLQTHAQPGQVVVGPLTYAHTAGAVRYHELGPVAVRGRDEPVPAYAAVETLSPPGQRPRRPRTPLIGRDQEMAVVAGALRLALTHRRPQLVMIAGEAGIGKSRLAAELRTVAEAELGALVITTRCVPYGEANGWWPLADALRQELDLDDTAAADTEVRSFVTSVLDPSSPPDEASRVTEGLRYVLGDDRALAGVDPARAREEALRSLIVVLAAIARHKPVVVSISELHWADPVVLDFIDRLLPEVVGLPVAVIGTARSELLDRWLPGAGRHNVVLLHLEPLTRDAAVELLTTILEGPPPDNVARTLLERAGGNPLFLEELGLLVRQTGLTGDLPHTLRGLVATRLDALPRDLRRVVDDAAVVGRMGSVGTLSLLVDGDEAAVTRLVEQLAARELMRVDGHSWVFASDVVREVAYETLSKAERARRHARLAAALEQAAASGDSGALEPFAHHAASAAEVVAELGPVDGVPADANQRALAALARAAAAAEERGSDAEALRQNERALALAPAGPEHRRFLVGRARARIELGLWEEARSDLADALDDARADGDVVAEAAALTAAGHLAQTAGAADAAIEQLDAAIEAWERTTDHDGLATALRLRGMAGLMRGRPDEAEDYIRRAFDHFDATGNRRGRAWAQQHLAWVSYSRGDLAEADRRLEEAVRIFSELGDYGGLGWATGLRAWVRLQQGNMAEADRLAEQVGTTGGGDRWANAMMLLLTASTRLWTGRTAEAVERGQTAVELFATMGDRTGQLRALGVVLRGMVAEGRVGDALSTFSRYRDLVGAEIDPEVRRTGRQVAVDLLTDVGRSRAALDVADGHDDVPIGLALLQAGRLEEAVTALERELAAEDRAGVQAAIAANLALAQAATGAHGAALATAERVLGGEGTYRDRTLAHLARAFSLLGNDPQGADAALAAAATEAGATGDRLFQILTTLAAGHAVAARGGAGDPLGQARSEVAALGVGETDWDDLFATAAKVGAAGARER